MLVHINLITAQIWPKSSKRNVCCPCKPIFPWGKFIFLLTFTEVVKLSQMYTSSSHLQRCVLVGQMRHYRLCIVCKCHANKVFRPGVNLTKANFIHVVLRQVYYQCKSAFIWIKCVYLLYIHCRSKVVTVSNVHFFLTFTMVCNYCLNGAFTAFAFQANLSQKWSLYFSKYDQIWLHVVFSSYLIQICYRWKWLRESIVLK